MTTTYTNQSRNSNSYSNSNKNSSSFSNISKTLINSFLLLENGFYILLETGSKIILDQSVATIQIYTNQTKN